MTSDAETFDKRRADVLPRNGDDIALVPISVSLGVRPTRAAVLVPDIERADWRDIFVGVIATQSSIWGGSGNLLLPLPGPFEEHALFWAVLDRLDPDIYLVYAPAWGELEQLLPDAYAEEHARRRRAFGPAFDADALTAWRSEPALSPEVGDDFSELLIRRVAPFHHERAISIEYVSGFDDQVPFPHTDAALLSELPASVIVNPSSALGSVERLLLAAEVGHLSQGAIARLQKHGHASEELSVDDEDDWRRLLFGERTDSRYPWLIAELGLAWYRSGPYGSDPVTLVVGDDIWDFVLFYALRRWTSLAFWLPASKLADASFCFQLLSKAEQYAARAAITRRINIVSASDDELPGRARDRLHELAGNAVLGRVELAVERWEDVLPESPNALYERDNFGLPQPMLVHNGATAPLPTPLPRQISADSPLDLRWVTEVRVESWVPLRNRHLATELLEQPNYGTGWMRTSREGLAYFCPHFASWAGVSLETLTVRPRLRPRTLLEQLTLILEAQGWRCAPSDKGVYAAESSRLLGGATDLGSALRDPDIWAVLSAYRDKNGPGCTLSSDRRRYLRLADLERVALGKSENLLARLEHTGVLTRGLILKCKRCRAAAWYHLADIGLTFHCARCHLEQPPSHETWLEETEPAWYYRLEEVIYQLLEHDGELPLLAAFELTTTSTNVVDQTFELDIWSPDDERSELDIAVADRHRLWIGEATKTQRFEKQNPQEARRLERLRAIAGAVDAYGILLSTSAPSFDKKTDAHAYSILEGFWPRYRSITGVSLGGTAESSC